MIEPEKTAARLPSWLKILPISILFLLSGLSSLIYQVIWTRMLVFVFGSTTLATSTVLAVFMGGLALGSYLAGRFADRTQKPFVWYGVLEGIVGVWAILAPFAFDLAIPLYKLSFEPLHSNTIGFGLLRFAVAALILLVPTACMGATLPLLSRFVTENLSEVGDRVGSLYAVNTLGAVLGSLSAGFIFLPTVGLRATTFIAAATNLALAGCVFLLCRQAAFMEKKDSVAAALPDSAAQESQGADPAGQATGKPELPGIVPAVMASIAVSGALALTYEVAWTRALLMIIGSSTYAFTVMLSTFLTGIFLGSLICARFVDRLKMPVFWFGLCELLLCLAGFLAMFMFNYLPYFNVIVGELYPRNPGVSMLFRFIGAGCVLVPISLCLGFIFPLAVKVCARDLQKLGSSIGKLYAMNTLGAILGAFISGFIVIPGLGAELTLIVCSAANLWLGMALLIAYGPMRTSLKAGCAVACLAVLVWTTRCPQFWDHTTMVVAQGERRQVLQKAMAAPAAVPGPAVMTSLDRWQEIAHGGRTLKYYKDGETTNVAVLEYSNGGTHALLTNGHVDASDSQDMENQAMLAALPLLASPAARDVCVVGWGSGVTTGFGLRFPVQNMVCVEREPLVLAVSPFFRKANFSPESDKRLILEMTDGRNFLLGTGQKFDVIISEPSNPWQAGVCNLFTREYFKICRDSLKKDGVFTMWSQTNEVPPKNLCEVFAALRAVFPSVYIMDSGVGDVNALAFVSQHKLSFAGLKESLQSQKVVQSLSRFALTTPEDFIARIIVSPDGVDKLTAGVEPNTDDSNHLEYEVARTYENHTFHSRNAEWMDSHHGNIWDCIDWGGLSEAEKARVFVEIARASLSRNPQNSLTWCRQSLILKENPEALSLIAQIQILQHNYAAALETIAAGEEAFAKDERFVGLAGVIALKQQDYARARQLLARAVAMNSDSCNFRYFLSLCYSGLDVEEMDGPYVAPPALEPGKVVSLTQVPSQNARFVADKPKVLLVLADAYKSLGKYEEAEKILLQRLKSAPADIRSWQILAEVYGSARRFDRSNYCWNKAFELSHADVRALMEKATALIAQKKDAEALRQIQLLVQLAPADKNVLAILGDLGQHYDKARQYLDSLVKDSTIIAQEEHNPEKAEQMQPAK